MIRMSLQTFCFWTVESEVKFLLSPLCPHNFVALYVYGLLHCSLPFGGENVFFVVLDLAMEASIDSMRTYVFKYVSPVLSIL